LLRQSVVVSPSDGFRGRLSREPNMGCGSSRPRGGFGNLPATPTPIILRYAQNKVDKPR